MNKYVEICEMEESEENEESENEESENEESDDEYVLKDGETIEDAIKNDPSIIPLTPAGTNEEMEQITNKTKKRISKK